MLTVSRLSTFTAVILFPRLIKFNEWTQRTKFLANKARNDAENTTDSSADGISLELQHIFVYDDKDYNRDPAG